MQTRNCHHNTTCSGDTEKIFHSHSDFSVNFTPISSPDYERWVSEQTKPRFTVTLLSRRLHAQYLSIGAYPSSHSDAHFPVALPTRLFVALIFVACAVQPEIIMSASSVTKIIFENNLNIDSISRLSGRMSLRHSPASQSRCALQFEVRMGWFVNGMVCVNIQGLY